MKILILQFIPAFLLCVFFTTNKISAQDWTVPENKLKKTSSFEFNASTIEEGKAIFLKTCQSCHGLPTKGNFALLNPSPGDPASDRFQNQIDGALFYKITNGRGLMPSFKNVLSETDRWKLISYIRSFNNKYKQPPLSAPSTGCKGCITEIVLHYLKDSSKIQLKATGSLNGKKTSIADAEVSLFIERYFGDMQIGKTAYTDSSGSYIFNFPGNIPGDNTGKLTFIARITDEKMFGETQDTIEMQIGIPTDPPPLNDKRAMWNVVSKAPLWLVISYSTVVLGVLACLLYIIFQLFRFKKSTKIAKT